MSVQISKSGNQLNFKVTINNFRRDLTIPADSESLLSSPRELTDQNPYNITFPKMKDISKAFIDCGYIQKKKINPTPNSKEPQPESVADLKWSNLNLSIGSVSTTRKSQAQKSHREGWVTLHHQTQRDLLPRKPLSTSTAEEACPLQKISPQLAVSMDIEAIESGLDLSLTFTPRTRIIREWQAELDGGCNGQDLSKTKNLVVPGILLQNSVCSVNSEDGEPVELEGSRTGDEFIGLDILTEVLTLSWYYSVRGDENMGSNTPRPVVFLVDKEFSDQTVDTVDPRLALQVPNNTPGIESGTVGNGLIDTFAKRVESYTQGQVVNYRGSSPKAADDLAANLDARDKGPESPLGNLEEEARSIDSDKSGLEKGSPQKCFFYGMEQFRCGCSL